MYTMKTLHVVILARYGFIPEEIAACALRRVAPEVYKRQLKMDCTSPLFVNPRVRVFTEKPEAHIEEVLNTAKDDDCVVALCMNPCYLKEDAVKGVQIITYDGANAIMSHFEGKWGMFDGYENEDAVSHYIVQAVKLHPLSTRIAEIENVLDNHESISQLVQEGKHYAQNERDIARVVAQQAFVLTVKQQSGARSADITCAVATIGMSIGISLLHRCMYEQYNTSLTVVHYIRKDNSGFVHRWSVRGLAEHEHDIVRLLSDKYSLGCGNNYAGSKDSVIGANLDQVFYQGGGTGYSFAHGLQNFSF